MKPAVASSPEAQEFVRELRLLNRNTCEPNMTPSARRMRSRLRKSSCWSKRMSHGALSRGSRWRRRLLSCAVIGAIAIGTVKRGGWPICEAPRDMLESRRAICLSEPRTSPVEGIDRGSSRPAPSHRTSRRRLRCTCRSDERSREKPHADQSLRRRQAACLAADPIRSGRTDDRERQAQRDRNRETSTPRPTITSKKIRSSLRRPIRSRPSRSTSTPPRIRTFGVSSTLDRFRRRMRCASKR